MAQQVLRRFGIWIVVLGCAAAAWWLWRGRDAGGAAPTYRTEKVDRGIVEETVIATGTISPVTTVQVGSQVSGIVAALYADFNSPVHKGQLLAELDPTPFQAVLDQRRADLTRAEVELRRTEVQLRRLDRLTADGLTAQADDDAAQADYDAARAQVEQARAAERQAETNLSYTKIYSPIDGVVVARQYDVGQTVAASFQAPTLFTIAQDLTKMQVQAAVDQADIGRVQVGQSARFNVDAFPDDEFTATISQIRLDATVNQNVVTYPVILTVDNREGRLHPQMTANVTIVVSHREGVLRIPNAALRFRPAETTEAQRSAGTGSGPGRHQTVYVLDDAGRPKAVAVRIGATDGHHSIVVEGLSEGDAVITGLATVKSESRGSFPGGRRF